MIPTVMFRKDCVSCLLLLCLLFVVVMAIYQLNAVEKISLKNSLYQLNAAENISFKFSDKFTKKMPVNSRHIQNMACQQPQLTLENDALAYMFTDKPPPPQRCVGPSLFALEKGFLKFNLSELNNRTQCIVETVEGTSDHLRTFIKIGQYSFQDFNKPVKIENDFIFANCRKCSKTKENLEECVDGKGQLFMTVVPNKNAINRAKSITPSHDASGMNVLMFGIDSMSRLNVQRNMPLTLKYLKEQMGAYIMEGYNILGDGTAQALLPMLLGKLQQQEPNIETSQLDGFNFIWKRFKKSGYVTMFDEDDPLVSPFVLKLNGFSQPPTDHYSRHFWVWEYFMDPDRNKKHHFCVGKDRSQRLHFKYLNDFYSTYEQKNIKRFSFSYSCEVTHSLVNGASLMDSDFRDFLETTQTLKHYKNTIIIVFSDHGLRHGDLRRTVQGKLEERLPFMSIVLPENFKKNYPHVVKNLKANTKRLTTAFDVHETLLDVLNMSRNPDKDKEAPTGISLFRPIPLDRTCADAGIAMHWCTCVKSQNMSTTAPIVLAASHALINYINSLNSEAKGACAELKIQAVHQATLLTFNDRLIRFSNTTEENNFTVREMNVESDLEHYVLTVETDGCHGLFEATVQVRFNNVTSANDELTLNKNLILKRKKKSPSFFIVKEDISRIKRYSGQQNCVCKSHAHLMKFCCCNSFLKGETMDSCYQ